MRGRSRRRSGRNATFEDRHCERSEAIHSAASGKLDCFVAALLAMTGKAPILWLRLEKPMRDRALIGCRNSPPRLYGKGEVLKNVRHALDPCGGPRPDGPGADARDLGD